MRVCSHLHFSGEKERVLARSSLLSSSLSRVYLREQSFFLVLLPRIPRFAPLSSPRRRASYLASIRSDGNPDRIRVICRDISAASEAEG